MPQTGKAGSASSAGAAAKTPTAGQLPANSFLLFPHFCEVSFYRPIDTFARDLTSACRACSSGGEACRQAVGPSVRQDRTTHQEVRPQRLRGGRKAIGRGGERVYGPPDEGIGEDKRITTHKRQNTLNSSGASKDTIVIAETHEERGHKGGQLRSKGGLALSGYQAQMYS